MDRFIGIKEIKTDDYVGFEILTTGKTIHFFLFQKNMCDEVSTSFPQFEN